MEALLETLSERLRRWNPETASQVRERVREIIGLADQDALDVLRSRACEQDVLDILDEPAPREIWLADLVWRRRRGRSWSFPGPTRPGRRSSTFL
jgi:hypothetical protein